jgi:hypothetical protein
MVMAGLCVAGAVVTAVDVSDARAAGPAVAPHPRTHGCALPDPDPT